MSISRRTDHENHLWADLTEPPSLNTALAHQIISAVIGSDPKKADQLANLLLTLERDLADCEDPRVDAVIEQIDELVEMAFQRSEPYHDYLEVYRMTVNQRCGRTTGPRLSHEHPDVKNLMLMVFGLGKRWGGLN